MQPHVGNSLFSPKHEVQSPYALQAQLLVHLLQLPVFVKKYPYLHPQSGGYRLSSLHFVQDFLSFMHSLHKLSHY